jgi:K+/H+ antiporter YhaU regulatory subunit KhtT
LARGKDFIVNPGPDETFAAGDRAAVIGTAEQVDRAAALLGNADSTPQP